MKIKIGFELPAGVKLRLVKVGLCTAALGLAGSSGILLCVKLAQKNASSFSPGNAAPASKSRPYDTDRLAADTRTLASALGYLLETEPSEASRTVVTLAAKPEGAGTGTWFAPLQPSLLASNRPGLPFDLRTNMPASS